MPIIQNLIKPQTVYIQYNTTNKSFIDMHYYLKNRGIQNNDFFLQLYDRDLMNIDPRDPNLPNHMKIRVLNEVKRNYWYFVREVVRIPTQGSSTSGGSRYKLHRGNLAMGYLFTHNMNQFVVLPRQHFKSASSCIFYLWAYNFRTTNSEIMFIHKDHNGSKKNLKDLKNYRDALPSYLRFDSAVNREGKKLKIPNTVVHIEHPYNHNKIITLPSARTKESANNIGRGNTQPLQYYDEFAFMPYNKDVYLAATPAFSTASQNAKANLAPYGMTITTTPGDLLTESGKFAYELLSNATPWREEYYDMTLEQLEGLRLSNTTNPFFSVVYSYKQLGSGMEYFKRMIREMAGQYTELRREVMLEWQVSTGNCPFSSEDLEVIKQHNHEPIRTMFFGKFGQYQMDIYENIDTSYPPIIGVDVSGATFNDSSAITIIDSKTTKVCATLNCNFIPYDDLADIIYQIVTRWLPNATVNIERNGGFGLSVIQRLAKTSAKKNLYWEIKDRVIEEKFDGYKMAKRPTKVKVYGTNSTKDVRARCIDLLRERVMYHKDKFIAPILHQEMSGMEVKNNGKCEHSANSHDDQVFSYLMALYVWYDGKNLAENFGIVKNTLKTDDSVEMEELDFEDQLEAKANIDPKKLNTDESEFDQQLNLDLEWIEHDMKAIKSADKLQEEMYEQERALRNHIMTTDPKIRKNMEESDFYIDATTTIGYNNYYTNLPDTIYNIDDEGLFNSELDEIYGPRDAAHQLQIGPVVTGNLSDIYNRL